MSKVKIEDAIIESFVSEANGVVFEWDKLSERANALDFIAHLRTKEVDIPLGKAGDYYIWSLTYKGEEVCLLEIEVPATEDTALIIFSCDPKSWVTGVEDDNSGEYVDASVKDYIKEAAWANVRPCCHCKEKCRPGSSKIVFGKRFDNLCGCTFMFDNPGGAALECAKKMIDARISDIDNKN